MTRANIITEKLRLDECGKGDSIRIPYQGGKGASWRSGICIKIVLIKATPKAGMMQVKYMPSFTRKPVIQKMDIPGDVIVERTREVAPADGEGAGKPVRETVVVDDVKYVSTDGSDLKAAIEAATQRGKAAMVHGAPMGMGLMAAVFSQLGVTVTPGSYAESFFDFREPEALRADQAEMLNRILLPEAQQLPAPRA